MQTAIKAQQRPGQGEGRSLHHGMVRRRHVPPPAFVAEVNPGRMLVAIQRIADADSAQLIELRRLHPSPLVLTRGIYPRYCSHMTQRATVEVYTSDNEWIASNDLARSADGERVTVPGCTVVGEYMFRGKRWINYTLPKGAGLPRDWDKVASGATAAPAEWVH